MIPYILHVSILIAGCYIFYWLLLRKETFHQLNRGVLLASLLISFCLPLIKIPASLALPINKSTAMVKPALDDDAIFSQPSEVLKIDALSNQSLSKSETITPIESQTTLFNYQNLFYLYLIGVGIFAISFFIQLVLILAKVVSLNSMQDDKYKIVELVKDEAPYSFWNTIFINPAKYDRETYEQILAHEKIHIDQKHYLDLLLVEFAVITFWFNPFIWLFRIAITNNLEFLTDKTMLIQGFPKQSYQMSILKVSVPQHPLILTTNYNQSFLKNRIAMMNTKKSSARSVWKYLFILPLLGFSILSLNAIEKPSKKIETIEIPSEKLGENTIIKTNERPIENLTIHEPSLVDQETEDNKKLKKEVMAQLEKDNLLDDEAPVFKIFPNKILLNDKPLNSKFRKKYKAIFLKYGIKADESKLLVVKPLVIMSGSFVGNGNAEDGVHIDVSDEADHQENDQEQVTIKTTTTTTTTNSGSSGAQVSVRNIEGKTYISGNGKHYINGKAFNIKAGEVTVIDEQGNSKTITDPESVEKILLKTNGKSRHKSNNKHHTTIQKVNRNSSVTTTASEESTSGGVEISIANGKTSIKRNDKLVTIEDSGIHLKSSEGFSTKHKRYLNESSGDGNFNFLHATDLLTTATNRFWTLPSFCEDLNYVLVADEIINSGDKIILYYLGSEGIFLNGQHFTGSFVQKFERIAEEHKIPLAKEFHFELDRDQVIILDQITSINQFKKDLLEQLSKDNLISNKKKKMIMEISGNSLSVNGINIPANKYATYFQLFSKHRLTPAPGKTIETKRKKGKDFIQVGYIKDNSVLGTFASF